MSPDPSDPEAWNAYLAEGNARQARKRVSADVLLRDQTGGFLLVKPTYKPGWDLPGGMAEANEAPDVAAVRELREELGLVAAIRGLLVVDWVAPHGPWDDLIAFVFDGGVLDAATAARLRPCDGELSGLSFVAPGRARGLLSPRLTRRFAAAVAALGDGVPVYLRTGGGHGSVGG
ncbi:NUDIX hydrolase [Streptomyces mobaraensis NBRC 13819 = DSM 40847]|uniref:NUDIX hydrolase n=1 Tax=Streptomyces mobaraensis (strain ATCC 29032 / DSM 40847 / JCM 4168 / NBRC 13819 / NCIMB 11159 / IPCR 16-22) TaxID=1223523 RepID=M3BIJ4_STRM1|nr:NUDIX hydrolase [Streptomyces mobaraensis]EME99379.1 NUDIX hydrolase [Streptomyces mobaraensis NBRC 13819 = DSM 40847]QTT75794.1 NUDIX hydrolase [Streptomyces mobaraensis NBRC 13819 = DSM 40847]